MLNFQWKLTQLVSIETQVLRKILPLQVKYSFMLKTLFSVFTFLFIVSSFSCYAEQSLYPARNDLLYRSEYKGYVSENVYEKTYKVKDKFGNSYNKIETTYLVVTIENGPNVGEQLFYNVASGKLLRKDSPDTYIDAANGNGYFVYDYDSHVIYHNINEERMIAY